MVVKLNVIGINSFELACDIDLKYMSVRFDFPRCQFG